MNRTIIKEKHIQLNLKKSTLKAFYSVMMCHNYIIMLTSFLSNVPYCTQHHIILHWRPLTKIIQLFHRKDDTTYKIKMLLIERGSKYLLENNAHFILSPTQT